MVDSTGDRHSEAGTSPVESRSVLRFEAAGRTYFTDPPVIALKSVDLEIQSGDYIAMMGKSGSGKSTLLNLMGLLDRASEGRLIFEGKDTAQLSDNERTALRSAHIGFVFQSFNLLPFKTCLENIELALAYGHIGKKLRSGLAFKALDQVGLGDKAHTVPNVLSGGEKQRVAIARAISNRPALLLCDEPTGNLDTASANQILGLIDHIHQEGMTVVVVTHDLQVANRAQRLIRLTDGFVQEDLVA